MEPNRISPSASTAQTTPSGQPAAGVRLAGVLPVHETGHFRIGLGWLSRDDDTAWHEAAHATIALSFGWQVQRITLDGGVTADGLGLPDCASMTSTATGNSAELAKNYRRVATQSIAGAAIVTQIAQDALDIPGRLWGEGISPADQRGLDDAVQHIPEVETEAEVRVLARHEAVALVLEHAAQFGALVTALLEERTLDERRVQ